MDDLSRKFRSLDWKSFQKSARKMQASTASALKDLVMTDLENKTRSATSDTPWGASTTDLQAIATGTNNRDDYALIMSIVWQRLGSSRWRCVYKALEVLKYLLMHGSSRVLHEAKGALGLLETLRGYRKMEGGRDVGEGVRRRAEGVVEMLRDEAVLRAERERSEELRRKMVGGDAYSTRLAYGAEYAREGYGESVSRVGTSGFKGYDDDDGETGYKGYDDVGGALKGYGEPNGEIPQKQDVDDLLGGEPVADDDDDDDEFDPRGGAGNAGERGDAGELFDALALAEGNGQAGVQGADGGMPASGGKESTSALVARLAAEKSGAVVPVSTAGGVGGAGATGSVWDDEAGSATASAAPSGAGIWADTTPNPPQGGVNKAPVVRVSKKEEDPFGDLLATARKTVL